LRRVMQVTTRKKHGKIIEVLNPPPHPPTGVT